MKEKEVGNVWADLEGVYQGLRGLSLPHELQPVREKLTESVAQP